MAAGRDRAFLSQLMNGTYKPCVYKHSTPAALQGGKTGHSHSFGLAGPSFARRLSFNKVILFKSEKSDVFVLSD